MGKKRRMITELYELFGDKPTGQFVKEENNRSVKDIAWKKLERRRKNGRPKKRWKNTIQEDFKEKNIQNRRDMETKERNGSESHSSRTQRPVHKLYI